MDTSKKRISDKSDINAETRERINYVIDELIMTEEKYIVCLRRVVEDYMPYIEKHTPPHLTGRTTYLFGNIQKIYEEANKFLFLLKQRRHSINQIAFAFIESTKLFELLPQYSKNKPTADVYLKDFDEIIKKRQKKLKDKLGLAHHLLTPIPRLGKYILLLEKIQKELKKSDKPSDSVNSAITEIRKVMRKGNDFLAIDSIEGCKVNLTLTGSFIMRGVFNVLKPRKFVSMVFLFENVVVFTERISKNTEQFKYIDSIQMSNLGLSKFEDESNIFHLRYYPMFKKTHHVDRVIYVLEAESPKIKKDWTYAIEAKLWSQLKKAKELQERNTFHDSKHHLPKTTVSTDAEFQRKKKKSSKKKSNSRFDDDRVS